MNILNILKDKPKGTKLYSPICGECELLMINSLNYIKINKNGFYYTFNKDGRYLSYTVDGECLLFPSNEMRDWDKYLWKKGDVLTNGDEYCIFDHFPNDKYNTFIGKFVSNTLSTIKITLITEDWTKVEYQNSIDHYINSIEHKYNGKLNLETLEIEKKEHKFEPFERVLVRDTNTERWRVDIFRYFDIDSNYPYKCIHTHYVMCIPYEGNEYLINTRNNPTE